MMQNFWNREQVLDWAHRTVCHRVPGPGAALDTNSTQGQVRKLGPRDPPSPTKAPAQGRCPASSSPHPGLRQGRVGEEGREAAEGKDVVGGWMSRKGSEAGRGRSRGRGGASALSRDVRGDVSAILCC